MNQVNQEEVKLFRGRGSEALASKIALAYEKMLGHSSSLRFSDGEISYRYNESIRGHNVFLIQSTCPPADNIMELLLMIDAAKRASARYVTAVVPYFGYARQDRKDQPRVSIAAKLMANIISAAGANRLMTMDLHAGQIQGFFDIPVDHLDSASVFVDHIDSLSLPDKVFAAPDVGATARVRKYAKHYMADMVVCDKYRERANHIASMQIIGEVKGKHVILVDDLVDTGKTLCQAAEVILKKGAKSVRAICTHPVLSGDAYARIQKSELEELITTDTIPLKTNHKTLCQKIRVLSVAPLFAHAIDNIRTNGSISSLFELDKIKTAE